MKIEITETPKITYNKIIYVFKAKVENIKLVVMKMTMEQNYMLTQLQKKMKFIMLLKTYSTMTISTTTQLKQEKL
jgi:hypothetical protein